MPQLCRRPCFAVKAFQVGTRTAAQQREALCRLCHLLRPPLSRELRETILRPGLVGTTPSLVDLDPRFGDLRTGIDFRQVYATILEKWLSLPSQPVLRGVFEKLSLFRT
jgi:hypothetical protein